MTGIEGPSVLSTLIVLTGMRSSLPGTSPAFLLLVLLLQDHWSLLLTKPTTSIMQQGYGRKVPFKS